MVSNDIREQLILLAGSPEDALDALLGGPSDCLGTFEVRRPDTGEAFTIDGAWTFIIELLKAGAEVETMILDKPPGKTGYVMKCDGWGEEKFTSSFNWGAVAFTGEASM